MSNPTFQRRHYEAVAQIIRNARTLKNAHPDNTEATLTHIEQMFANMFRDDNHMFQAGKFADACQPGTSYRNRSR